MTDEARVLDALGDPTRRQIFELLASGERNVASLTGDLTVSQSAVSQHLRVLKDAGLVSGRADGTRRLYRIDRNGLEHLRAYVDRFWDDVLDSFTRFADSTDASGTTHTAGPRNPGPPSAAPGRQTKGKS